jgi:SAM-dependent methyltransferase
MDKYLAKENYITVEPNPETWLSHANTKIIETCLYYIHGIVIDMGCNHCATTAHLLYHPYIKEIYALDINSEALVTGYDVISKLNPTIPFNLLVCNLTEIPLTDEIADFIQSFHTLEHIYVEDVDKVISEAFRLLKPGGHFLISIPYDHNYPDPAHVAFYKVDTLCELLERNRFEVVYCMRDSRFDQKDLLTGLFLKPLN